MITHSFNASFINLLQSYICFCNAPIQFHPIYCSAVHSITFFLHISIRFPFIHCSSSGLLHFLLIYCSCIPLIHLPFIHYSSSFLIHFPSFIVLAILIHFSSIHYLGSAPIPLLLFQSAPDFLLWFALWLLCRSLLARCFNVAGSAGTFPFPLPLLSPLGGAGGSLFPC